MIDLKPLVIDTHAVIWWVLDSPRLSEVAANRMRDAVDAGQPLHVSAYSLLELRYAAEKPATRKGHISPELHDAIVAEITSDESVFTVADMSAAIIVHLGTGALPRSKGPNDPGDRVILATAIELGADIVTADKLLQNEDHISFVW
ncbi:PIN domain-containing protein [Nocardioides sp. NPDC057767]|uniref:PIN domain-containing protein n=1 Tax=unclassified Nocardioides TaxID=2615069 RepID=UPI003325A207